MGWKQLGRNRLLDAGAILIALLGVIRIGAGLPSRVWDFDFNHYYVSSRMLLQGQNPYLNSIEPMCRQMGFTFNKVLPISGYPPSFLRLFAPLAALPPRVAFAVWVAGEVVCLAVILWCTRCLLRDRLSGRGWLFVCAAALASETLYWHFVYSQVQLLLAALVMVAYLAHRRGHHTAACLTVAGAGMLKFFPFVLLPWFIWRSGDNTRRLRCAGLAAVFCAGLFFLTGPSLWKDFVQYGMPMAVREEMGLNFHYSLAALVTNLGLVGNASHTQFWWTAGTVSGLLVVALAYGLSLRRREVPDLEFSLLSVAMLAGTVTVQGHYFVGLVFPLALAAVRVAARPTRLGVLFLAVVLLLINAVTPPPPSFLADRIYLKIFANWIPLYGVLALGVFLGVELASEAGRQR
jgi:hypothetical protein